MRILPWVNKLRGGGGGLNWSKEKTARIRECKFYNRDWLQIGGEHGDEI